MKRNVYSGYNEYYMTGREIRKYFEGCYETFGKHHSKVYSKKINFEGPYLKANKNTTYRLFVNSSFCAIFDGQTDGRKYFFGYTRIKPA